MASSLLLQSSSRKDARDISTQILTKVSETPLKALNAKLASSWVAELDETIKSTKVRPNASVLHAHRQSDQGYQVQIHERISSDLPDFERQLATAVSVQERLRSLSQNVDDISESISDPQVSRLRQGRASLLPN